MIVDCPSCEQQYELGDDQVMGKSVILSCPPCNTSWIVGPIDAAGAAPAESSPDESSPVKMFGASQLPPAPEPKPMEQQPEQPARRVHKGSVREQRDLFASQMVADGRVQDAPIANARVGAESRAFNGGGTGERSEHSVLFTVDSLRAATMRPPPPSPSSAPPASPSAFARQTNLTALANSASQLPPPSVAAHDDAGVIDLAPMLSSGGTMRPRSEPLYTPVGDLSPMGFAMSVPPAKKTPFGLIAGISAAAVVVLGIVLGAALHGKSPSASDAAAELAPPPSRFVAATSRDAVGSLANNGATNTSAPVATPVSDSAASTTSASSPAASDAPAKSSSHTMTTRASSGKSKSKSTWTARSNGSNSASASFTPKSSAPPKPAKSSTASSGGTKKGGSDPCNCGGNLQCAMKCGL